MKYDRFLLCLENIKSMEDTQGYMWDMLSIIMTVLDNFRSINILYYFNNIQQR